ncbi:hypothetical protein DRQ25_08145 [Candidatus Fermentibacteria bacterium]|nr:MAG: hypothetical protein DRQ25_08145 [Candidatus Fermentibacteria bacterium]
MSETTDFPNNKPTPLAVNQLREAILQRGKQIKEKSDDVLSLAVFARRGSIMTTRELSLFMDGLVGKFGNRPIANLLKVNPGLISRVEMGMESPKVRRAMGVRKNPRRWRIITEGDQALFESYKVLLKNTDLTGAELLYDMMMTYRDAHDESQRRLL